METPDGIADVDPGDLDPWERQPTENEFQWAAFQAYRDLDPPRSLRKAAAVVGKTVRTMEKHSANCDWPKRVAAYDRHIDAQRRAEHRERNKLIERRQQTHLGMAANALAEPVRAFLQRIRTLREEHKNDPNYDPFKQFTLEQLQRMAVESIKFMNIITQSERLVAGLSLDPSGAAAAGGDLEEARRNAAQMSREECTDLLMGEGEVLDDGREAALTAVGVDPAHPA